MISRSIHTIFASSGRPAPSEDDVLIEAREIINHRGWGMPMIGALHKITDPYWREAIARCLMDIWNELVRQRNEQTYYYDMDGCMHYCWEEANGDFAHVIRRSTAEQVDCEQNNNQPTLTSIQSTTMQQNYQQINIGTQNNNCTQIGTQINNYYYAVPYSFETNQQPVPQADSDMTEPAERQSCLFSKKAQKEQKEDEIIRALQQSMNGRQDKARALVEEVRQWQRDGYLDSNYNARVMYDELNQILTLPFQYGGFRKYYNE